MTDREAFPAGDLSAWPIDDDDVRFGWDWDWDWDDHRFDRAPEPSGPPWYRSPRPLLALIAGAAATLVVAVALVITGTGEIPTRPALGIKTIPTSAPGLSRATPVTEAPAPPSSSDEPPPTGATEPAPDDAAEAAGAAPPVAPSDPPAPPPVDSPAPIPAGTDSDGPRTNVTRSPMSFTPGVSAKG